MPDRSKLAAVVVRRVLSLVPETSWVAVAVKDGQIVGAGRTAAEALIESRKKRPALERDLLAILFKDKAKAE